MRETQMRDAPARDIGCQNAGDGGMKVEVQMTIHMVERQAGASELLKLGVNLGEQLMFKLRIGEITNSGRDWIVAEAPLIIDQVGNFLSRQSSVTIKQREMKPNAQAG